MHAVAVLTFIHCCKLCSSPNHHKCRAYRHHPLLALQAATTIATTPQLQKITSGSSNMYLVAQTTTAMPTVKTRFPRHATPPPSQPSVTHPGAAQKAQPPQPPTSDCVLSLKSSQLTHTTPLRFRLQTAPYQVYSRRPVAVPASPCLGSSGPVPCQQIPPPH